MNTDVTRHTLVCAISTPDSAHWVLARALEEARHRPGTALELLHVLEHGKHGRSPSDAELDHALDGFEALVRSALMDLEPLWEGIDATCVLRVRPGRPAEEIAGLAVEVAADAILVGARSSRGHDVPAELLEQAECRLEVVRPKEYAPQAIERPSGPRRDSDELPLSAVLRPSSLISTQPTTFG